MTAGQDGLITWSTHSLILRINQNWQGLFERGKKSQTSMFSIYMYFAKSVNNCLNLVVGMYGLCYFDFPFSLFPVTSVIMQKNGAGLHTASSCYWDNTTDGENSLLAIS